MRTHLPALLLALTAACGGLDGGYGASDFGATPGGVKDLRLARELVAAGQVPPADALLVEAMFAEHDLGLTGAACARTLCLRGAAGIAPELDGTTRGWAQVGLSSTIDPATWQRPSTTFVLTVDVSGSMGWTYGEDASTPAALSVELLHSLANQLRPDDRVAIVTYGSAVNVPLSPIAGDQQGTIHARIAALAENGSTDMEAGMVKAYEIGAAARGTTEQVRVIVFTDVQPNVGATAGSEFEGMVRDAAAGDVHTTVLALGLGIGPEVMRAMASLRGANAYSLTRPGDIDTFMADEYPWFTTPIAYDLRVNASLGGGWSIDRGLGFPASSDAQQIGLKADTVFLSKRKGALLVALTPPAGDVPPAPSTLTGTFQLAYAEPDGTAVTAEAPFGGDAASVDERGQWFQQASTARTTALALLTEAMHDAAVAYEQTPTLALELLTTARDRFAADATALGGDDLPVELELVTAMRALVEQGAPQGTLYGASY